MRGEAWSRLIDSLIAETNSGRIIWTSAGASGGAIASTRKGSFVIRYVGGLGVPSRPALEVRDAEGQVIDRFEPEHPLQRMSAAIGGYKPVLPVPAPADEPDLVAKLDRLVATIAESSDRIEAAAFDILGGL